MKSRVFNVLPACAFIFLFLLVVPNVCLAGSIQYCAHIAYDGWLGWVSNGQTAGQPGSGKEMQATKISLTGFPSSYHIDYQAHIAYDGWLGWVSDGAVAGTTGQAKQMEAIRIALRGFPSGYHVEYRAYVQSSGWQGWVSDGATAGTVNQGKAIEGLQIRISADPPDIASISPSSVNKGTNVTFTLTGTGFQSGFTAQIFNENGQSWNITDRQYISATQVKVTVFIGEGTTTGTQKIKIINPDGQSDEINFTAVGATSSPNITSISPTQVEASTFDLTINGSNFDSGAVDQIYWKADGHFVGQGTVLTQSSTRLVVRESMVGAASGTYQIEVKNSDGQRSNRVDLVIINQSPVAKFTMTSSGQTAYENQTLNLTVSSAGKANIDFSASRSSDPDGSISSYLWKISGNQVSTSRDFSFSLGKGTHQIYLTVTDNQGAQGSVGASIVIEETTTTTSTTTTTTTTSATTSTTATTTISSTTSTSTTSTPTSTTSATTTTLQTSNRPPVAKLSMTSGGQTAYENEILNLTVSAGGTAQVDFSASRSSDPDGSISSYLWKISGTQVSTSRDFSFSLGKGTHQIHLTVTDNQGSQGSVGGAVIATEKSFRTINVPGIQTGNLDTSSSLDYYKFTLSSNSDVTVSLISTDFDTFLILRNASDTTNVENDNSDAFDETGKGFSTNSQISLELSADTYFILVSSNGLSGFYTLVIRDIGNTGVERICERISLWFPAVFPGKNWPEDTNDWVVEMKEITDEEAKDNSGNCVGRCGKGCPGDGPWKTDCGGEYRYTRDCLNHDACVGYYKDIDATQCENIEKNTVDDCGSFNPCVGPQQTADPTGSCSGTTPCYPKIQSAMDAGGDGSTIRVPPGIYSEQLVGLLPKIITLWGGWVSRSQTDSSTSTVNSLTITDGTIIIKNLALENCLTITDDGTIIIKDLVIQ